MVSWVYSKDKDRYDLYGLSTDTKPTTYSDTNNTPVPNGTVFFEMDTKKFYMFNQSGSQWLEI